MFLDLMFGHLGGLPYLGKGRDMSQPRRRFLYRSYNFFFAHGILQRKGTHLGECWIFWCLISGALISGALIFGAVARFLVLCGPEPCPYRTGSLAVLQKTLSSLPTVQSCGYFQGSIFGY